MEQDEGGLFLDYERLMRKKWTCNSAPQTGISIYLAG